MSCVALIAGLFLCSAVAADAAATGGVRLAVTDAQTGAPVADACVNAEGPSPGFDGCTDASGHVLVTNLAPGTYRFTFAAPDGYADGLIEGVLVKRGHVTQASATLQEASVIVVSLKDRTTGAPVTASCVYFVEPDAHGVIRGGAADCTDGNGQVRLSSLPARFRLFVEPQDGVHGAQWVSANGGTGNLDEAIWVQTSPGTTQQVTALLDPAGSIMVTATDAATGAGINEACPWIAPQGLIGEVFCSGSDGRLLLSGLGPYAWPVEVADYSGAHAWQWSGNVASRRDATPVVVTPGNTTALAVQLPPPAK